jgi:hypothetical protein
VGASVAPAVETGSYLPKEIVSGPILKGEIDALSSLADDGLHTVGSRGSVRFFFPGGVHTPDGTELRGARDRDRQTDAGSALPSSPVEGPELTSVRRAGKAQRHLALGKSVKPASDEVELVVEEQGTLLDGRLDDRRAVGLRGEAQSR